MRKSYYFKRGWDVGYYGYNIESDDLGILTPDEMWDYRKGMDEGQLDSIIDEDGAPPESYYEKKHNI